MADGDNDMNIGIVGDEPSDLTFHFEADNKTYQITKQFVQLSGMLRDYIESMPENSDNSLPVTDFPASSHEILIKLLNLAKTQDTQAYDQALRLEHVESEIPTVMKDFFKGLNPDDRIHAANYCAYLSMDYAKRYFVNAFANLVKDTPATDIKNLTAIFGATPLGKDDIEAHELQNERQIWLQYPDIYKEAYGHPYEG